MPSIPTLTLSLCIALMACGIPSQEHSVRTAAKAPTGAEATAKKRAGFRWFEGRWRLSREIQYLRAAHKKRTARDRLAAKAAKAEARTEALRERRYRALGSMDPRVRCSARDALLADAQGRGDARAEAHVLRYWLQAEQALAAATRRSAATGILSLQLQKTDLLGFDTVPVSFGAGSGGRLMLPRTRSISIGTTVGVPLGIR